MDRNYCLNGFFIAIVNLYFDQIIFEGLTKFKHVVSTIYPINVNTFNLSGLLENGFVFLQKLYPFRGIENNATHMFLRSIFFLLA